MAGEGDEGVRRLGFYPYDILYTGVRGRDTMAVKDWWSLWGKGSRRNKAKMGSVGCL